MSSGVVWIPDRGFFTSTHWQEAPVRFLAEATCTCSESLEEANSGSRLQLATLAGSKHGTAWWSWFLIFFKAFASFVD